MQASIQDVKLNPEDLKRWATLDLHSTHFWTLLEKHIEGLGHLAVGPCTVITHYLPLTEGRSFYMFWDPSLRGGGEAWSWWFQCCCLQHCLQMHGVGV